MLLAIPAPTVMVTVSASLRGGEPLSVTRMVTRFVVKYCAGEGDQANEPVTGFMLAPPGEPGSRRKVRVWAGRSGSLALAFMARVPPAAMFWESTPAKTGAELTVRRAGGELVTDPRMLLTTIE